MDGNLAMADKFVNRDYDLHNEQLFEQNKEAFDFMGKYFGDDFNLSTLKPLALAEMMMAFTSERETKYKHDLIQKFEDKDIIAYEELVSEWGDDYSSEDETIQGEITTAKCYLKMGIEKVIEAL